MQEIKISRKSEKVRNQKESKKPKKNMNSEKVGIQKKMEIRKSRKLEKVGNWKKLET